MTGTITKAIRAAAVLGIAWLPAQKAAAVNKIVSDQQGARAMTVCMLEDGEMHQNGDQIVCCVDRFCVACKDDDPCRVWSNDRKNLDSGSPRPEHSGATSNAPDPRPSPRRPGHSGGTIISPNN